MKVIHNAKVPSTTGQRDQWGQIREYLVVIFDTGEAQCTCPGYLYRATTTPEEKHRYRCKHIADAIVGLGGLKTLPATPEPPTAPQGPPPSRPRPRPSDLWLDDDEDAPRIRR